MKYKRIKRNNEINTVHVRSIKGEILGYISP